MSLSPWLNVSNAYVAMSISVIKGRNWAILGGKCRSGIYLIRNGIYLITYTDWAHNAHSVPFELSKNAHSVPSLSGVLDHKKSHIGQGQGTCILVNQAPLTGGETVL